MDMDKTPISDEITNISNYFRGLKLGYALQHHDPNLATMLIHLADQKDDVAKGMKDGAELFGKDIEFHPEWNISPEILKEVGLDMTNPKDARDKDNEREKDHDLDK